MYRLYNCIKYIKNSFAIMECVVLLTKYELYQDLAIQFAFNL